MVGRASASDQGPRSGARDAKGHAQGPITERYINAAQVLFPDATDEPKTGALGASPNERVETRVQKRGLLPPLQKRERPCSQDLFE